MGIAGDTCPCRNLTDKYFGRSKDDRGGGYPHIPSDEWFNQHDYTVAFKSPSARLESALAWHNSETRLADSLLKTMAASELMVSDGCTVRLPCEVLSKIDAYLFGERVLLRGSDA